jgi:hypothetical protein
MQLLILCYGRNNCSQNALTSSTKPHIQPPNPLRIDLNPFHLLAPFRMSAQRSVLHSATPTPTTATLTPTVYRALER